MSKDITENILLKAGFYEDIRGYVKHYGECVIIVEEINRYRLQRFVYKNRNWNLTVHNFNVCSNILEVDIQTVEHFNKLMELMDIDFRLKKE